MKNRLVTEKTQFSNGTGQESLANVGFRKVPVEEKKDWVSRHFDAVAKRYDVSNTILSFGLHRLWKREAVRLAGLKEGDRVIDLCGGTGDLSILAAEYIGGHGRVILYDINRKMMETGRPKIIRARLEDRVQCVQGDAERISFPDCAFDAAMVGFGIRNLTHMEAGFREIFRVLKPGGRLMCLEFSRPVTAWFRTLYDFYSFALMPWLGRALTGSPSAFVYLPESIRLFPLQDELAGLLSSLGFQQVRYRNLTNGIAVIHWGKK